jgi:hypothetical protein
MTTALQLYMRLFTPPRPHPFFALSTPMLLHFMCSFFLTRVKRARNLSWAHPVAASRINQIPHFKVRMHVHFMYRYPHGPAGAARCVWQSSRVHLTRASGADITGSMWTRTPPANANVYEDVYDDTVLRSTTRHAAEKPHRGCTLTSLSAVLFVAICPYNKRNPVYHQHNYPYPYLVRVRAKYKLLTWDAASLPLETAYPYLNACI